ncbi:MAG: permease [Bacteroidota bacterium]|nr:permease [Bacteroidota bacterium]
MLTGFKRNFAPFKKINLLPFLLIFAGGLIYINLRGIVDYLVYNLLGLDEDLYFTSALHFFVFQSSQVFLLLTFIIFCVGIIRSFFSPEKTRKALEGKSLFTGNVLASLLGVVTPFCSCSAVPLFIGFIEAGIPLGVTFSFLIAAPMINEVAVILLWGLFGIRIALIYAMTGLVIAIVSGWIIGKLNPVKWIEPWVYQVKMGQNDNVESRLDFAQRIRIGNDAVRNILKRVWIYIIIAMAVGAIVHGYVPADYLVSLMGKNRWYSVPLAVLIGIPLYSCAGGIIPIISVLLEKGITLGTALAFSMSIIGLSLPEIIILKKVLKFQMIAVFIGVVAMGIIIVGYLFNFFF